MSGWAQDLAAPFEPVTLLITVGDTLLARVVANRYRDDLAKGNIGHGRHAFEAAIDSLLLPLNACEIAIRREGDGAHLVGSPLALRAVQQLDDNMRADVAALLGTPCDDAELRARISFLAEQTSRLLRLRAECLGRHGEREAAAKQHAWRWSTGTPEAASASARAPLRALAIDETAPVASRDAGSGAILSHMASLRHLGYEVTFVPVDMAPCADQDALDRVAATTYQAPWFASIEEVLRREAGCFDLVYLHRVSVAACYGAMVRHYLPKARLIFSVADLHHIRLQRQAVLEDRPELMDAARRARAHELAAAWAADAVLTHSSVEAAQLRQDLPAGRVHVVPWSFAPQPTPRPFDHRSGVAFIGGYAHTPNVDAAFWLVEAIMPLVWAQAPGIECLLVGSAMPEAVRALARPGVVVLGQVADLASVFDRVRLTVAPLAYGAGVKGKVLASLAAGVPCVCTPVATEGIDLPEPLAAQIGGDPAGIATAILRLHADLALNAACAAAGMRYVTEHLSEAQVDAALRLVIAG